MAITTAERTQIIELTVLMFNAAPGATYLSQIVDLYEGEAGRNLSNLANILGGTAPYKALHPNFETAEDFATSFLRPLGLQADAFARDYVISKLNSGMSKAAVAYQAFAALNGVVSTDAAQYQTAKAILTNETTVAEYYSVTLRGTATDLTALQNVISGVTSDVASVDAAKAALDAAAGQTFTLASTADNLIGTNAADIFNATIQYSGGTVVAASTTLNAGDQINGGAGVDVLNVTVSGADLPAVATSNVTPSLAGVEKVLVSNLASEASGTDYQRIDLSLADSALATIGTAASTTAGVLTEFSNVGKLVGVEMAGRGNLTVGFTAATIAGSADALTLTAKGVGISTAAGTFDTDNGVETLNVVSSTAANFVTLGGITGLTTVNVSGDKAITLGLNGGTNSAITKVNASTAAGNVAVDASGLTLSAITVTGGSGTDTFETDKATTASTDFKNVTGFETLKLSGAVTNTFNAAIAGVTTFDLSNAANTTLNLNTGYTGATTVKLTGDTGDVVNNSANVALTVNANIADMATVTIAGGTGTDVLNLTADGTGTTLDAAITGVETLTVLANTTNNATTASITTADANVASGKTLTVDASALTNSTATFTFNGSAETNGSFNVTGGAGKDTITGGAGNDVISGGAGNDSITAGAGNDSVNAGDGNDTIVMAGNLTSADTIDGGAGTDSITVTAIGTDAFKNVTNVENVKITGANSVSLSAAIGTGVTFDLSDTAVQSLTLASGYTGDTTVVLTGDNTAADTVINSANVALTVKANVDDIDADVLTGGTGTDTLILTADSGSATLTNVTLFETLTIAANATDATKTVSITTVDGNVAANKTLTVDASALTNASATFTFNGSAESNGSFNITGGAAKDTITGGAGNDVISGGAGNDSIIGGAGNDNVNGGDGDDTIEFASGNFTFDDTVDGGAGNDTLVIANTGGTFGNAGELSHVTNVETLKFTGASEAINAGSSFVGFNSFDLTNTGDQALTLAAGFSGATTVTLTGDAIANADSVINTANVALTVKANVSDIDATTTITGGTGTDVLTLKADSGVATLTAVTNVETVTITANTAATAAINTVDATIASGKTLTVDASALTDAAAALTLNGSAETNGKFSVTGGSGNDSIRTGAGADTIVAGAGADFIDSGTGLDVITTGSGADLVSVSTNANALSFASVTDFGSGDALYAAGNGTETFTSTAITLSSAATLSDYVNAAAAATTTGGGGNSIWSWFNYGSNTYVVLDSSANASFTAGTDRVIELQGTLNLSTATLDATANTLTFAGTATTTAIGGAAFAAASAAAATFNGTAGADTFSMGAFMNTLITVDGGAGTDTLSFTDNAGATSDLDSVTNVDVITLGDAITSVTTVDALVAASGTITVNGSALTGTNTLTWNGTNETNGTMSVTGGAAGDTITGGSQNDTISGGAGADSLVGGAGADSITGGEGADNITGGAGADTIVLTETTSAIDTVFFAATAAGNGSDTITGFVSGTDKANVGAFETVGATVQLTGAITITNGVVYTLVGQAAGAADSAAAAITAMNAAATITDTANTAWILIVDDNSSAIYEWLGNAGGDEATGDTLTLVGTFNSVLAAADLSLV